MEKKIFNKIIYHFEPQNIIGKGINQVKNTLKGLNYYYSNEDKDSFYLIETKIKLFDELNLDDNLKSMIYLIDFPGFGTDNKFVKNNLYKKVLSFCNSYIFTVKNSIIKEEATKKNLYTIFNQIKNEKKSSVFIKSFIFILNNFDSQITEENDIIRAKKDIKYIIDSNDLNIEKENDEINVCIYNAQFYSDYRNLYNYFNNIESSLDDEFSKYLRKKNNIFKYPESAEDNYNDSFCDYLDEEIDNKIRDELRLNVNEYKSQKINEKVKNSLLYILNKFKDFNYAEMENIINQISQKITYGVENIDKINLLKNSNIEGFKKLFKSQIYNAYIDIQKEIDKRIKDILSVLDNIFFESDFSAKKNEPKEIENFKKEIESKEDELRELFDYNEEKFKRHMNKFKDIIIKYLIKEQSKMNNEIKKNGAIKVLEVINDQTQNLIEVLYENIIKIINDIDLSSSKILTKTVKLFYDFSKEKAEIKFIGFKQFLSMKMGDINRGLENEIYRQISKFSKNQILFNKGFIDWFKSVFNDYYYLMNYIDIITDFIIVNIDSNLSNIIYYLKRYLVNMINLIKKKYILATNEFTKEQMAIWKEIGQFYESLKGPIIDAKCKLCKNIE